MDTKYEDLKDKIIQELNMRAPNLRCPACNTGPFSLAGGYFAHDIQPDLGSRQMGGINIPTVPIVCQHCGYVMEFAMGKIGLLPKEEDIKKAKIDEPSTPKGAE